MEVNMGHFKQIEIENREKWEKLMEHTHNIKLLLKELTELMEKVKAAEKTAEKTAEQQIIDHNDYLEYHESAEDLYDTPDEYRSIASRSGKKKAFLESARREMDGE